MRHLTDDRWTRYPYLVEEGEAWSDYIACPTEVRVVGSEDRAFVTQTCAGSLERATVRLAQW